MAKDKTMYVCENCGQESPKWIGKCPACGQWNTFKEIKVADTRKQVATSAAASAGHQLRQHAGQTSTFLSENKVLRLRDISSHDDPRIDMHDQELNRVLGGGLVPGSIVLLGGEPGIGKSTLTLQTILNMHDRRVLYVSGEESAHQLKMRAERLSAASGSPAGDNFLILCENSLEAIFEHIKEVQPELLVVDSIQTISTEDVESSAGSIAQVRECASALLRFAKASLYNVYDFHAYNNTRKAAEDLRTHHADLIVCKHQMPGMTGSELCNHLKTNARTERIKFVLMTDETLSPQAMKNMNITLSADDYLAKPFNMQEAIMRFNKLLGLGAYTVDNLIEGAETRRLESRNTSMTTATESIGMTNTGKLQQETAQDDEELNLTAPLQTGTANQPISELAQIINDENDELGANYTMNDAMDRQLLRNIEQYVLQNMSRGQISLEEMASVMGMGRVPFFHKIRNLTGKTPAELVRDLRLKHASILLKRTNINMSELATNVGFITAENFIKVFKEKFGLSPLEYRLKHRQ